MPLRGVTARLVAAMAMIGGIAHTQRAAIRLQLDGLWSVKELSSTLSNLATAYDAAVALHFLGTEEFLSSQELLAWIPPSDARGSDDLNATIKTRRKLLRVVAETVKTRSHSSTSLDVIDATGLFPMLTANCPRRLFKSLR